MGEPAALQTVSLYAELVVQQHTNSADRRSLSQGGYRSKAHSIGLSPALKQMPMFPIKTESSTSRRLAFNSHQLGCDRVHMAHGGPHAAAGELVSAELAQPAAEHALLLWLGAQSAQHARQRMQYAVRLVARACNIAPQIRTIRAAPRVTNSRGLRQESHWARMEWRSY